jgi:hypothetical protein
MVSLFTGFAFQLDPRSLHESMDLQTNSRRMMELRENNIGQKLEFGSCNLHDNWIVDFWTLVVCFCSPLKCTLQSETLKLKSYK